MNSLYFADPAVLETIVRPEALLDALRTWGVRVATVPENAVPLVCSDRAMPGKLLRLMPSWLDGHWRITEEHGAGDARPSRIAIRHAAGLDAATIHAAASSFPDPGRDPAQHRGSASDAATWRALASGLEVVAEGDGSLVQSGLCHPPIPPCGGARLNARDAARRWLTADLLFSAVPAEPEALAWLIADALASVSQDPPRVSIVINNHNYADYLGAAIESAHEQEVPAHEVIVIDDGSTDASRTVMARYGGTRTLEKENGGQGSAFNAGFGAASGDLIVFLDADDRLAPDAVATLQKQDLDGIARISFALETIDSAGRRTGLFPTSRLANGGDLKGRLLRQGFLQMMPTSGNAFPRSTLDRLLPMPEAPWRTSADVYLVFGAAFLGTTRHVDRVLGQYRVHGRNAYHATFGAEAQYNPRKLAQRRRAFGDVARRMEAAPGFGTPRDAAALRAMSEPGSVLRRIDAWRADILGPRKPLSTPPLANGKSVRPPPGRLRRHLTEHDPGRFGGAATWPCLAPGAPFDLTERSAEMPLGDGWTWSPGTGAMLSGRWGVLASRVPGSRADWQVRLHHHAASPGNIAVWVNGTRLDDLCAEAAGLMTLNVGGDLLVPDPKTRSWRLGITLVPERDVGLRLTALEARRILPAVTGAAVLRPGSTVRPQDPAGRRMLAEGWCWPDAEGARMARSEATLRFSVAEAGRVDLLLDIDHLPMIVSVGGRAVATIPDAGGRGILVPLAPGMIPHTGELEVGLVAPNGDLPRLRALRLFRTGAPGTTLPPGHVVPLSELTQHVADTGVVTVSLPETDRDPLVLTFEPADGIVGPRRAELTVDGRPLAIIASGGGGVTVRTAPAARSLTYTVTDTLRLTGLGRAPATSERSTPPVAETLDAGALHARALVPDAWTAADGEAIWLASQEGELSITRPPGNSTHLRATALVLPGTGQTLTLRLGSAVARTTGEGGVETLVLPLPETDPGEPLLLAVETDTLIEAASLGVDMPGLLGGALVRLDIGQPEVSDVAHPQTEGAV